MVMATGRAVQRLGETSHVATWLRRAVSRAVPGIVGNTQAQPGGFCANATVAAVTCIADNTGRPLLLAGCGWGWLAGWLAGRWLAGWPAG